MKRIFLTSGLVLCMACPAFAEGNVFTNTSGTLAGECDYGALDTFTGPTQLRAIWTADDYTLRYIANAPSTTADGQSNTVSGMPYPDNNNTVTLTYDDPYTVSAAPSLTGYQFNGWLASNALSDPAPTGNIYSGSASISQYKGTGAQTMTAQWTPLQYDVIYNTTTHSNAYGTQNASYTHADGATYDADYALPQSTDAIYSDVAAISAPKTGYSFVGWTTDSAPDVTRTDATHGTVDNAWTGETPWRRTADLNVYAAYIANQYNITYSCTGGEPNGNTGNADGVVGKATGTAPANTLVTYDQSYALAENTCELKGYIFAGWDCPNLTGNDDKKDTITGYFSFGQSSGKWTGTADVACTAKWKPGTITDIQWDADGGSYTGTPSTSCTYDDEIVLPTNPQKTGYTFGGWEVVGHNPSQPSQQ